MTNHQQVARIACEELSEVDGISKLLLFGSVARGQEEKDSDIDIAIIFDNFFQGLPLDLEGFPQREIQRVKQISSGLSQKYDIKIDICPFWESQYERGIKLCGLKHNRQDSLNETGMLMYEALSS